VPRNSRGSNSARAAIEDLRARAKKLGIDLAIFEH